MAGKQEYADKQTAQTNACPRSRMSQSCEKMAEMPLLKLFYAYQVCLQGVTYANELQIKAADEVRKVIGRLVYYFK